MFIGHYSASLAARALKPALPLWHLFVAVQLVDFAWAVLVMLGIEKVRYIPHFMEASHLDLYHMPFTHSLPASLIWALGAGLIYAAVRRGEKSRMAGVIIAAAVFSHWLLDFLVHGKDLLLYAGGPKVGLGLWNSFLISQTLEIGLLLAGAALYLLNTRAKGVWGWISPVALIGVLLTLQGYNHLPMAEPPTPLAFGALALTGYTVLTVVAWLVDLTRVPK